MCQMPFHSDSNIHGLPWQDEVTTPTQLEVQILRSLCSAHIRFYSMS